MNIVGVVLAGGYSTRMGKDKSSLLLGKKTMLERAVLCMVHAGIQDIFISCRKDAPLQIGYPLLYDAFTDMGPLSGIYSALHFTHKPCLFLPVDTPCMQARYLTRLINIYPEKEKQGIEMICFQSHEGVIESLVSIFSPHAIPSLAEAIRLKIYKITKALPREKQYYIPYHDTEHSFYNVNTPKDLDEITPYIREDNQDEISL